MERTAAWNDDFVVIDTTLHPTSEAVEVLARHHGYGCPMLRPRFSSWEGARRYRDGSRRAFICGHADCPGSLDTEPVGTNVPATLALRQAVRRSILAARLLAHSADRRSRGK